MTRAICTIVMYLILCSVAHAQDSIYPLTLPVEVQTGTTGNSSHQKSYITVMCIDGYKWIVAEKAWGEVVQIAQLYKESNGGYNDTKLSTPVKCK